MQSVRSLPAPKHAIPQLLPASEVETPGVTLSLGRLQAGSAESSKRPQAASGEVNDWRFSADPSSYKSQGQFVVLPQLAIQCFGKICWRGRKGKLIQLQFATRLGTLRLSRAMPNPSLKRTPNGISFWPRKARCAHNASRGQNAMPPGAA